MTLLTGLVVGAFLGFAVTAILAQHVVRRLRAELAEAEEQLAKSRGVIQRQVAALEVAKLTMVSQNEAIVSLGAHLRIKARAADLYRDLITTAFHGVSLS